jgi:glycosyltransferase involved in cell wall biosynthesis
VNVVLPNGVDFDVCSPVDRAEACTRLGLDPKVSWILFGGSPSNPAKGYGLFRDVLQALQTRHPGANELILSEPGQPYERVVLKLNAASCLLFTSRRGTEGSPTVVKEALAVGLPVVSVDVGDVPEMLEGVTPGGVVPWPSGSGGIVHDAQVAALASEAAKALASGGRSNGREARASLRQEEIARRLVAIYRDVVREGGRDLRYR